MASYTINSLCGEARALLQDVIPTGSVNGTRYSNQDLLDAFNDAVQQIRVKRPDAFLGMGLRTAVPIFTTTDLTAGTPFPIDNGFYPAVLYYVVGRCELREDTFSDNGRAISLMNKFVSQILQVAS